MEGQWNTGVLLSQLWLQWWRSAHAVVVPSGWQGWHYKTIPESLLDQNTPLGLSFPCTSVRSRNVTSWAQKIREHQDSCFLILLQVLWNYRCDLVGGWRQGLGWVWGWASIWRWVEGCPCWLKDGSGLSGWWAKAIAIHYLMSLALPFRVQAWDITWIKRLWWY